MSPGIGEFLEKFHKLENKPKRVSNDELFEIAFQAITWWETQRASKIFRKNRPSEKSIGTVVVQVSTHNKEKLESFAHATDIKKTDAADEMFYLGAYILDKRLQNRERKRRQELRAPRGLRKAQNKKKNPPSQQAHR